MNLTKEKKMKKYHNTKTNEIYAYDDEQLATIDLINALEAAMQEDDSEELRAQYDAIDPIFFTIRDNINEFTEVDDEEVAEILRKKQEEYEKTDEYQALLREQQKMQKAQLLSEVKEEIEILNDAIDFDEAEEGDEDYLVVLKKYRVQLNKVDTDIVPCEFPAKPEK